MNTDVLVIGGGPAGLAAAIAAAKENVSVTIIERKSLGGILNQCIHNGFGLQYFSEELTGPEYAERFVGMLSQHPNISVIYGMVSKVGHDRTAEVISTSGAISIRAKSIVLAMGCRERARGSINIAGSRPAGVITAGTAQELINIYGKQIGKNIVILGSGDIGLIMARRLKYEGANVIKVIEIMPNPSGLQRNITQCLDDYKIPLELSTTVVQIKGTNRVESVVTAKVDNFLHPIAGTEQEIKCDTLVLSVGLIPENDLVPFIPVDARTKGAFVNSHCMTNVSGFFACGNALHVHDLVDNVTEESERAGRYAAMFAQTQDAGEAAHNIYCGLNVASVVPQSIISEDNRAILYIRASRAARNIMISVKQGDVLIKSVKQMAVAPNETISLSLPCQSVSADLTVSIEEG